MGTIETLSRGGFLSQFQSWLPFLARVSLVCRRLSSGKPATADSRHAVQRIAMRTWGGNVPCWILRSQGIDTARTETGQLLGMAHACPALFMPA